MLNTVLMHAQLLVLLTFLNDVARLTEVTCDYSGLHQTTLTQSTRERGARIMVTLTLRPSEQRGTGTAVRGLLQSRI